MHEFFFEKSNYKVGASENNLQIYSVKNREELFTNYYVENNSEKDDSILNKKFLFFEKITKNKNKFKFSIKTKIIYSLSIFGLVIILGLLHFFISQSKKNESNLTNKLILLDKRF